MTHTPDARRIRPAAFTRAAVAVGLFLMAASASGQHDGRVPWHDAAQQRIAEHRMAGFAIEVVDAEGQPIPDATVNVAMTRHAFGFGTAVNRALVAGAVRPEAVRDTPAKRRDAEVYREKLAELFNVAVMENGHKWRFWENDDFRADTIATTQWLLDHDIRVRGHTMIWQHDIRTHSLPDDVYHSDDPDHIRTRLAGHLQALATQTYGDHGPLTEWDVLNEQWSEHRLTDRLNPGVPKEEAPELVEWFKLADAATPPGTRLMINDYGILAARRHTHLSSYERTVRFLLDHDAPLHGIGFQGHFGHGRDVLQPEATLERLNRFGQYGLPMTITEFDQFGDGWTDELRARHLREFMTVCFSHPQVDGFLIWGFWDGWHWKNSAPLFAKDWTLKPEGRAYMDLVFGEWWTDESVTTDAGGQASLRGFLGDYQLTATTPDGQTLTAHAKLSADGTTVRLQP